MIGGKNEREREGGREVGREGGGGGREGGREREGENGKTGERREGEGNGERERGKCCMYILMYTY